MDVPRERRTKDWVIRNHTKLDVFSEHADAWCEVTDVECPPVDDAKYVRVGYENSGGDKCCKRVVCTSEHLAIRKDPADVDPQGMPHSTLRPHSKLRNPYDPNTRDECSFAKELLQKTDGFLELRQAWLMYWLAGRGEPDAAGVAQRVIRGESKAAINCVYGHWLKARNCQHVVPVNGGTQGLKAVGNHGKRQEKQLRDWWLREEDGLLTEPEKARVGEWVGTGVLNAEIIAMAVGSMEKPARY